VSAVSDAAWNTHDFAVAPVGVTPALMTPAHRYGASLKASLPSHEPSTFFAPENGARMSSSEPWSTSGCSRIGSTVMAPR
jgi:hypothetical protein